MVATLLVLTPTRGRLTVAAGILELAVVVAVFFRPDALSPAGAGGAPSLALVVSLRPSDDTPSLRPWAETMCSSLFLPFSVAETWCEGGSPSLRLPVPLDPRLLLPDALDSAVRFARLAPRLFILTVIHSYDALHHWRLTTAPGNLHSHSSPSLLKRKTI